MDLASMRGRVIGGALLLCALATAGLAWLALPPLEKSPGPSSYQPLENSLAILPFSAQDATPNGRRAAQTLFQALLHGLGQSTELTQVQLSASHTLSDPTELGRRVRAQAVLDGQILPAPGGSRIEVELRDVATGSTLWSRTLMWDPTRIMELGTSIANGVLGAMSLSTVSRQTFLGTSHREAYDAYLLGYRHMESFNVSDLRVAMAQFERATNLDPEFVHAYYALAQATHAYLRVHAPARQEREQLKARRDELLEIALGLDPDFAPAISMTGMLSDNAELAFRAFDRALELDPDSAITYWRYAHWKQAEGDFHEAERLFRKALDYRPMDANFRSDLGGALWRLGRTDEAVAEVERSIQLEPRLEQGYRMLGAWNHFIFGDMTKAAYYMRKAYSVNPEEGALASFVAGNYAELGLREESLAFLDRALATSPTSHWAWAMAGATHQRLRDHETAKGYFAKLVELDGAEQSVDVQIERLLEEGQPQRALELFVTEHPEIANDAEGGFDYDELFDWHRYADLLIGAGETEHGRRVIENIARSLESHCDPGPFIWNTGWDMCEELVWAYAKLQDRGATLAQMRRVLLEQNHRFELWNYDNPEFDFLREDPEFTRIMAEVEADVAAQRERVIAMECNGEMPPAPGVILPQRCP